MPHPRRQLAFYCKPPAAPPSATRRRFIMMLSLLILLLWEHAGRTNGGAGPVRTIVEPRE
jgi:hypothetical protein